MRSNRIAVALAGLNLVLLTFIMAAQRPLGAKEPLGVLRGSALELVDQHGKVRAEIRVMPADPSAKMPDGRSGYPETVLLRLISSNGAPNVKLATTEDGAGLVIGSEKGYLQLISRENEAQPALRIQAKDGRKRVVEP
jgi:hypothetical protein